MTKKLTRTLAAEDAAEDGGMPADDRTTCHTHQSWAADCEHRHQPLTADRLLAEAAEEDRRRFLTAEHAAGAFTRVYDDAPELDAERAAIEELMATEWPRWSGQEDPGPRRELMVRKAAAADREWLRSRTPAAQQEAETAAILLSELDRTEGTGPGAQSPQWQGSGGHQEYVRAQYRLYYSVPPGCADPCDDDPCAWHQR
ncbi:hypothetical protein [Kitasatospora sp. MBT66]|uniref:hypothetical protein n=1 Tax=Kitasatospora sp. MBT66 TaxID=1444769 RepID=UPI0007C722F2|nr:hypothetical protein [Kitasatospora sp. MBT66]